MGINLLKASENGKRPQIARLTEAHIAGSGYFVCEGLSGWADAASFVVYEADDDGEPVSGSETDWIAERNSSTLQNAELTAGIDRDYATGKTFLVATETAGGRNRLINGLKNTLDDEGNLKQEVIGGDKIKEATIQAKHIDWASFSETCKIWTTDQSIVKPAGEYELASLAITEKGKYAFQGVIGGVAPTDTDYVMVSVKKGGDDIFAAVSSIVSRGNVSRYDVPFFTVDDCAAGDVISFVLTAPTGTNVRAGTSISAMLLLKR